MALKFQFPIDGDFVNSRDGQWLDDALYIDVLVESDYTEVTVCGVKADFDRALGCFKARIPLYGYRNRITAKTQKETCTITVF